MPRQALTYGIDTRVCVDRNRVLVHAYVRLYMYLCCLISCARTHSHVRVRVCACIVFCLFHVHVRVCVCVYVYVCVYLCVCAFVACMRSGQTSNTVVVQYDVLPLD